MSTAKRQHFVPQFLLRRFALTEGRWQGHIFRLPVAGGPARPAVPRSEAAKNRYYDLPEELVGDFQPEKVIGQIESGAAAALQRLESGDAPRDEDLAYLSYFVALQTNRTPQDRAEARFFDELIESQLQQLRFSAREQAVAFLRQQQPGLSEEEAEAQRVQIVNDLNAGRLGFESSAEREVAGMFLGLNEAAEQLGTQCDFTIVNVAGPVELILPDTGYSRYDPQPRVPGGGSGFIDTDTVETVFPVAPTRALVVTRGSGRFGVAEADARYAEDLNLRAFAQSAACVYGRGQAVVVAALRLSRQRRRDLAERRRRPRTMWFLEEQPGAPAGAPLIGTGYSIDGIRTELFDVDPRAHDERQGIRAEDMWK